MKSNKSNLFFAVAAIAIALAGPCVHAAGFQQGLAADPNGKPLVIGIWYPSQATAKPVSMGPTTMTVAFNAPLNGKTLPLVVTSHGTGGSFLGHFDTAIALADAGFVVVAMNHTGDNYSDQSRSVDIMDRPRQVSRVIDHMLSSWEGHTAIDPERVEIFGFSSGGFTALASIGGVPDFSIGQPVASRALNLRHIAPWNRPGTTVPQTWLSTRGQDIAKAEPLSNCVPNGQRQIGPHCASAATR
jgi:predicted dienelactone hydrolase